MFSILLQSWDWRPEVMLLLLLFAGLYSTGWLRIRLIGQNLAKAPSHNVWHLISYLTGIGLMVIALMSPIDVLGQQLFAMHMVQHLIVMMIVPPLLMLANPYPVLLWGLPKRWRRGTIPFMTQGKPFRFYARVLASPVLGIAILIVTLCGWHLPFAYDAALRSPLIHDVEHLTFFGAAMIYWWHVVQAAPHIRTSMSYGTRVAYLLFTLPFSMLIGLVIAFADSPLYPHYTMVPRLWGLSVMQDQMLGGVIMWVPGSMMYVVAAIVLVRLLLKADLDAIPLASNENI
ncbi:MAG: cytochrome c oxidase assembly protein [Chloroflexota bacterium]